MIASIQPGNQILLLATLAALVDEDNDKPTVIALREIAEELITNENVDTIGKPVIEGGAASGADGVGDCLVASGVTVPSA